MSELHPAKVTGETITDEQIRQLWNELTRHEYSHQKQTAVNACIVALRLPDDPPSPDELSAARQRCADAWNTRLSELAKAGYR